MKIPDISKIDIKDIDVVKIQNELMQRKELVVQVLLALASIVVGVSAFNGSQAEIAKYKSQIASLQAKTGAIDEYNKTQGEVKDFINKVPAPVSQDKMITLVTDLAGKNDVKILTFNQAEAEKKGTLVTTAVNFSLETNSFANMIRFMAEIERDKDFMQISTCKVEPQLNAKLSANNPGVPLIFHVDVVSLKVEQ